MKPAEWDGKSQRCPAICFTWNRAPPGRRRRPDRGLGRHQNRGRFAGTPLRRGNRSGQGGVCGASGSRTPGGPVARAPGPAGGGARRASWTSSSHRGDPTRRRGRLGDDQPAPDVEEGSGALGHHGRPAEGPGQDPVEAAPEALLAPADLCPVLAHRHPAPKPQAATARPGRRSGGRWRRGGPGATSGHARPRRGRGVRPPSPGRGRGAWAVRPRGGGRRRRSPRRGGAGGRRGRGRGSRRRGPPRGSA